MLPLKKWEKLRRGYRFGQRTFYSPRHLGLDIIAPELTPILAWKDLDIVRAFFGAEGGNQVWIKERGGRKLFRLMHLWNLPRTGFYARGQTMAYVGNTGKLSSAPHLHIDISRNGVLQLSNFANFEDPEKYFSQFIERKNMLKIVGDQTTKRQYVVGADGIHHWVKDERTLDNLLSMGIVDTSEPIVWLTSIAEVKVGDTIATEY